jgi:segregation and condensation protein A
MNTPERLDDPQPPDAATGVNSAPIKRATNAATPPPPVRLETYEGPLDLLLDLIRRQQINIYDIPIAQITQQYLDYLRMLEEMNIDVAGEFILMAATLIYIKSRMLLPADPATPAEEQPDPRAELVQRLLEHEQFKNAAQMLQSKRLLEEAMWSQPGMGEFVDAEDEPGLAVSIFDLITVFHGILERAKKRPSIQIRREEVTVAEMIEHVKRVLLSKPHSVTLEELMEGYLTRPAVIALLLALLEMVRLRAIQIRQRELFAPITVHRNHRFAEIMAEVDSATLQPGLAEYDGRNPAGGGSQAGAGALEPPAPGGPAGAGNSAPELGRPGMPESS